MGDEVSWEAFGQRFTHACKEDGRGDCFFSFWMVCSLDMTAWNTKATFQFVIGWVEEQAHTNAEKGRTRRNLVLEEV